MKPIFLIADDSPWKLNFLKNIVESAGWHVDIKSAATTEEGESIASASHIDFAWIDYYIPSARGPSLIAFVKKHNPAARIALISSSAKESNNEEARAAGAEACICTTEGALNDVETRLGDLLIEWKAPVTEYVERSM